MRTSACKRLPQRPAKRRSQSGIVMVMTLICLTLMLVAAIALTRSSTNSLLQSGNLAFRRDLLNQGERGMAAAVKALNSGTLNTTDLANDTTYRVHYSASTLENNAQGIPLALVNAIDSSTNDIRDDAAQVTIVTVIDRQCSASGAYDSATCVGFTDPVAAAQTGSMHIKRPKGESRASYRISVRVTGPRNTQVFHQMVVAY